MKSMEQDEGWEDFKPTCYKVLHCLAYFDSSEEEENNLCLLSKKVPTDCQRDQYVVQIDKTSSE